jgi:hypothetical protein
MEMPLFTVNLNFYQLVSNFLMQWFIFAGSGKIMEIISNPFFELAAILIIAAIVGLVGRVIKATADCCFYRGRYTGRAMGT